MAGRPFRRFRDRLPGDWPTRAVEIAFAAHQAYTDGMRKDWPVESVERELALAGFEEELDRADERGELGEADAGWWARWEGGTLDAELDHVLRTYEPG